MLLIRRRGRAIVLERCPSHGSGSMRSAATSTDDLVSAVREQPKTSQSYIARIEGGKGASVD